MVEVVKQLTDCFSANGLFTRGPVDKYRIRGYILNVMRGKISLHVRLR
jgi:hypothetical protein